MNGVYWHNPASLSDGQWVRLLGSGRHLGVADRIAAGGRVSATVLAIGCSAGWHSPAARRSR